MVSRPHLLHLVERISRHVQVCDLLPGMEGGVGERGSWQDAWSLASELEEAGWDIRLVANVSKRVSEPKSQIITWWLVEILRFFAWIIFFLGSVRRDKILMHYILVELLTLNPIEARKKKKALRFTIIWWYRWYHTKAACTTDRQANRSVNKETDVDWEACMQADRQTTPLFYLLGKQVSRRWIPIITILEEHLNTKRDCISTPLWWQITAVGN